MRRAIYLAIVLFGFCRPALAGVQQRVILQLMVNEVEKGEVICLLRPNDILVRSADLEKARLRLFSEQRETIEGEIYVSLASLAPNLAFRFDERALVLHLSAQPSLLESTILNLRSDRPARLTYSSESSAFLNYAINLRNFQRFDAFGEAGLNVQNGLLYSSVARDGNGQVTRGLTNWTLDDRERLMRWVIGDNLVSSGNLGGTVSLGGISFAREFNLDPYFIRQPGLGLSGTILTPSTVDIYVNGLLVRREQLPPGQFELRNLPVPAGSGDTRLVIRDAFGREREVTSPFYFTTGVLAPGLHEYGYNLGFRRNDLGSTSWDYGTLAFVGRHRVGLTESFTAGLRLEAARGVINGGPVITGRFPFGEVEMAAAASRDEGHQGGAASLAYSYLGRTVSFGFLLRFLSAHYAHLSLGGAEDRPQVETSAAASMPIGSQSTLTLQYNRSQLRDGERDDRLSISASTRLAPRLHLFLSGSQSWKSSGDKFSTFAGLSYHFGKDITASLSHQTSGSVHSGTVQLQKALPLGTGFGYRLESSSSASEMGGMATIQYQGPYGRYEGSYEHMNGQNLATLSVAGALVAIGGSLFPTRPIQESFALLRVPELEAVRGYLNNQEVGRTNARGELLVPNLLPYYGNRLGIADQDIPLDRSIDATEKISAPPYRGGTMVVFPVRHTRRFAGSLLIEVSGETQIPAYGQLTVTAAGERFESPISKSGHYYLENVPAGRHPAAIEFGEKVCRFELDIPKSNEPAVELRDSRCVMPETKP